MTSIDMDRAEYRKYRYAVQRAVKKEPVREWSLITGRGGLQNGRGGHVKFYPYKKGGWKKF